MHICTHPFLQIYIYIYMDRDTHMYTHRKVHVYICSFVFYTCHHRYVQTRLLYGHIEIHLRMCICTRRVLFAKSLGMMVPTWRRWRFCSLGTWLLVAMAAVASVAASGTRLQKGLSELRKRRELRGKRRPYWMSDVSGVCWDRLGPDLDGVLCT